MTSSQEILDYFEQHRHSRVDAVTTKWLKESGVRLSFKREDLLHLRIPGNKWRKLKYNLVAAAEQQAETIATFGGAWSNHIAAVAAAGSIFGFRTIGFIRGEEHLPLNPVLSQATHDGMQLIYLDRDLYRRKHSAQVIQHLEKDHGPFLLLPEGGSNELAVRGCEEILTERDAAFDLVCCSVGTGGTLAGIIRGLREGQRALGFAALKGAGFLRDEVGDLCGPAALKRDWEIALDYHAGGYAKSNAELDRFMSHFESETAIPLDPIYTGKMIWGVQQMVTAGTIKCGTNILAIHTANHPERQIKLN